MNKTYSHPTSFIVRIAAAISKLRDALKFEVPVGYQDESGFYYGKKPVPVRKQTDFPSHW